VGLLLEGRMGVCGSKDEPLLAHCESKMHEMKADKDAEVLKDRCMNCTLFIHATAGYKCTQGCKTCLCQRCYNERGQRIQLLIDDITVRERSITKSKKSAPVVVKDLKSHMKSLESVKIHHGSTKEKKEKSR